MAVTRMQAFEQAVAKLTRLGLHGQARAMFVEEFLSATSRTAGPVVITIQSDGIATPSPMWWDDSWFNSVLPLVAQLALMIIASTTDGLEHILFFYKSKETRYEFACATGRLYWLPPKTLL